MSGTTKGRKMGRRGWRSSAGPANKQPRSAERQREPRLCGNRRMPHSRRPECSAGPDEDARRVSAREGKTDVPRGSTTRAHRPRSPERPGWGWIASRDGSRWCRDPEGPRACALAGFALGPTPGRRTFRCSPSALG